MLILSWNVAGWSTTIDRVQQNYGSLTDFFDRHNADVVCLQEHKIPRSQLTQKHRQSACLDGWESFWSCCTDEQSKGMNGVVTYAKGQTVFRANSRVLGPDLDQQGRCLMTDHGSFVLFNVYVPASGGNPLSMKMKFLHALQRAMREERAKGKSVILVGDLNIAHTKHDIYWKDRAICVDDIMADGDTSSMWKNQLRAAWPTIRSALETKEVVETRTSNSMTGETYNKLRLMVSVENKKIALGKPESSADYCLYGYDFDEYSYYDEVLEREVLAKRANVIRIQILAELLQKIAGVAWSEETLREMANSEADIEQTSPTRRWLSALLRDDHMVDVFRHFNPDAQARFTCWNQFTNRRYYNDGSRIDYTIVDRSLLPHVRLGEPLRCASNKFDRNSEEASLAAATANGLYQPVSFEGGGIQSVSRSLLDTQFGVPHSGIVYTPPSFSDHVGVSLLIDDSMKRVGTTLANDANTKKTQPHKLQRSIKGFFVAATSKRTEVAEQVRMSKRAKRSESILHHFKKKN